MTSPATPTIRQVESRRSRRGALVLLAFAGYSVLAVVLTFPLVLRLSSHVPADLEDSLWYVTVLWWNAQVMPLTGRWWDGFAFYPASGMMAFSDHLLGASLIASPLQWLGCSPVTAYNLTFLASFPLTATAAHVLALALTRRHDAAIVSGLAYGFNPYRMAHLEHLELLLAFGMPLALAALHQYALTGRARWLLAFSAALTVQALSASYYALFFAVLTGIWILWFVRPSAWRTALAIGAAGCLAAVPLLPIALGYSRIHHHHDLTRDPAEILAYSADITSVVTASALSALWGWTALLNAGERQLFPGLTIVVLAIVAVMALRRFRTAHRDALTIASKVCWALSACLLVVAVGAQVGGPWRLDWGWLTLSVTVVYKPLSLAAAFAIVALALGPTWRAAFRRRSVLAFYLMAAAVLFVCSLGPRPTFLGEQILYEPPYAWLMRLPLFSDGAVSAPSVRVPARFAMLAVLALSVSASLAVAQIASSGRRRIAIVLAVCAGIIADGWIRELPLHSPPASFRIPPDDRSAAVLELPFGTTAGDTAAMYRATLHLRPTANGYHSYAPLSYHLLRIALRDRDPTALDALASAGPILIAVDNDADATEPGADFVADHPRITRIGDDAGWTLFRLPRDHALREPCTGSPVAITAAFDSAGEIDVTALTDGNPATRWATPHPQRAGDHLVLHLRGVTRLCGLALSLKDVAEFYPRTLRVATSLDHAAWKTRFLGRMGGSAVLAAIENPRDPQVFVPLSGTPARFVRLQIDQSHPYAQWAVADVVVKAER